MLFFNLVGEWVSDGLNTSFLYSENLALQYLEMPYGEIFLSRTFKYMSLCLLKSDSTSSFFDELFSANPSALNYEITDLFSLKYNDLVQYIIVLFFFQEKNEK